MADIRKRIKARLARAKRIRKKVKGTQERPRLCVKRSLKHMVAQLVDDTRARSLAQVSSCAKEVAEQMKTSKGKIAKARLVGNLIAERALALGIKRVVFDRSGSAYHGRVKAMAEGARAKGLEF